jgi:DNA gyrase subunit B
MADPKDTSEEEDKVEAAYENISKKLESIRSGKTSDDDGDSTEEKESSGEEEELWETTMDPEQRVLKQVTIDDAQDADKVFDLLMGVEVAPRKSFIQSNAKLANLDV